MSEDVQTMSVRFPRATYERLRREAFERRTPMNTIITTAVVEHLDRYGLDSEDDD